MTDWQTVVATYWPYLLGAGVIGLIIGWFFTWLVGRNRKKEFAASMEQVESRLRKSEQDLADARKQSDSLKANLSASEASLSSARSELEALKQEGASVTAALEERQAAALALESDLDQTRMAAATTRESLESIIETVTADKLTLQGQLDATRVELAGMKALAEANAQALASKDTALNEAYMRAVILQRDLQEREKMLMAAQNDLDTLKIDLVAATSRKAEMESKLHRARGDVAGEMALVTSTMLKMKDDALSQANARIAMLTKEIEILRSGG